MNRQHKLEQEEPLKLTPLQRANAYRWSAQQIRHNMISYKPGESRFVVIDSYLKAWLVLNRMIKCHHSNQKPHGDPLNKMRFWRRMKVNNLYKTFPEFRATCPTNKLESTCWWEFFTKDDSYVQEILTKARKQAHNLALRSRSGLDAKPPKIILRSWEEYSEPQY